MLAKRVLILLPVLLARLGSAVVLPDEDTSIAAYADDNDLQFFDERSIEDDDDHNDDGDLPGWGTFDDDLVPSLVERSATPTEDVDLHLHENIGLGTVIGSIANRLIWYTAGKVSKTIVKAVLNKLLKSKTPDKHQTTIGYVEKALESITVVVLTKAIGKIPKVGTKLNLNLGADAGDHPKVRRGLLEDHDAAYVSWDISNEESHFAGNELYGRAIVSDDIRSQLLDEGIHNVTAVYIPTNDEAVPMLAYTRDDDSMHIHWRPEQRDTTEAKAGDVFNKHYPFFDAGGAGFKLSAMVPIDPKTTAFSPKDAAAAAKLLVQDFLHKRLTLSAVGYQEQNKQSGWVGHQLCFIAEDTKFELDNQISTCFAAAK